MKRILLATLATAALSAVSAFAADLPSRPNPAPLLSPAPVYSWTGIYGGLNGGYGWGSQDPLNLITNRFDGSSVGFNGGVFGGTAGAQIQSGHVVIGFEADIDWAGMKGQEHSFRRSAAYQSILLLSARPATLIGRPLRECASATPSKTGSTTRLEDSQCWARSPTLPQRQDLPAVIT